MVYCSKFKCLFCYTIYMLYVSLFLIFMVNLVFMVCAFYFNLCLLCVL